MLRLIFLRLFSVLALTTLPIARAELLVGPDGIHFKQGQVAVQKVLKGRCVSLREVVTEPATYPLAKQHQSELICDNYQDSHRAYGSLRLLFADDELVHLEALLQENHALSLPEAEHRYLDMQAYAGATVWYSPKLNRLSWVVKEGLHPNLFSYGLHADVPTSRFTAGSLPDGVVFNGSLQSVQEALQDLCQPLKLRTITPAWLPGDAVKQQQLDCFNLHYAGFPRKLELVFADQRLKLIWVLAAHQELPRLELAMEQVLGQAQKKYQNWSVFADGAIALRKDKPEMLLLAEELVPWYQPNYVN